MILLTVCLIGAFALVSNVVISTLAIRKSSQEYNSIKEGFMEFFVPAKPEDKTPFIQVIDYATDQVADKIRISIMASTRGAAGAAVRDANRGLEELGASTDPALAVAKNLPKSLQKNPLALAGLNYLMQNTFKNQSRSGAGNGSSSQVKFNL